MSNVGPNGHFASYFIIDVTRMLRTAWLEVESRGPASMKAILSLREHIGCLSQIVDLLDECGSSL